MIILGWIVVVLLLISVVAVASKSEHQTFTDSFMLAAGGLLSIIAFLGACGLIVGFILALIFATWGEPTNTLKPTILVCNTVTVAESVDGFKFNNKSGTYEDYRSSTTYTPRQGEVCKQYLKGKE